MAQVISMGWVCAQAGVVDLKPHWDSETPLANPDKGWYHHYPDNHVDKYRIARDADLLEFPGMDHLYIRLAWAYLEPEEGQYRWEVIDDLIEHWTERGLGIAFRISCRETSTDRIEQQFATPQWVRRAGAKGGFYRRGEEVGPDGPWEPVYDDPVFLGKLERFLMAFGARYDSQPWLRYVDIGSLGDWGEGHTWFGSRTPYGYAQRRAHVDLYRKAFRHTQLVATDDFVYEIRDPEERLRMHRYLLDSGISYRDDSILVDGYLQGTSDRFTVRSPEFFADAYRKTPTVFELEHYSTVKRLGNWLGTEGSNVARFGEGKTGPDYFRGALGLLHATYIGYHGDATDWRRDNPQLTGELLNRCGYWYFLHQVEWPDRLVVGETQTITLTWENRGVAPAYQPYALVIRLEGPLSQEFVLDARNKHWMPADEERLYRESYELTPSGKLAFGAYTVKLKLRAPQANRDVALALQSSRRDANGFYTLGTVRVVEVRRRTPSAEPDLGNPALL